MTDGWLPRLASGALFALYPLVIYLGLHYLDPRWLALIAMVVAAVRVLGNRLPGRAALALGGALAVAAGASLLTGSEQGLLWYPVLVNLVLFCVFIISWLRPPTVIETLARLREPELSPAAVAYTGKVTLVWSLYFVVNGTLAALTLGMSREYWALYNGLIAYLLMAALFGGELLVRRKVKERTRVA